MTVSSDQAVRNQQMMMLVLGMAAAKALVRNGSGTTGGSGAGGT